MKNILLRSLIAVFFISLFACKAKNINKITGYEEVRTGMESRKYKDVEGETYYSYALGQHGDESEARFQAMRNAQIEFGTKAEGLLESAYKREAGSSLKNKVGKLTTESRATLINKAISSDMTMIEQKLYYSEDTGGYQYRAVYKISLDNIIKLLQKDL